MSHFKLGRRALLAAVAACGLAGSAMAGGHQVVDSIHFLIPGGAGGGLALYLCSLNAATPPENVRAAIQAVRDFGAY